MLSLSILCWLMLNSVAPVPTWCWVFWWIGIVVKIIEFIVNLIKVGMEIK